MENSVHLDPIWIPIFGGALAVLFGIIAFFLSRLVSYIDKLGDKLETLNTTMSRIDRDLSGDVSVLKSRSSELDARVRDLDHVWDRMRAMEESMIAIKHGGCDIPKRGVCANEQH